MKKRLSKIIAIILCVFALSATLTGCGKGGSGELKRDEKTINVRAVIGGYGDSWLRKLAAQFNKTYAEQGYKVNVLASATDLSSDVAMKELYSKDDWADVYFVTVNNTMARFTASRGEYGQLVADLTDTVWNKPAINFEGKEESGKLISEKARVKLPDDVLKVDGRVYGFNTSNDIGGMIVNMKKLAKYGITEVPKTTKELFDAFELIYLGDADKGIKGSLESRIYPITYLGGDNGYPIHFVTTWQAQYSGIDEYNRFYGYYDEEGNDMLEDGYTVYNSVALEKMLEAMYNMYDASFVALGSANNTISSAHMKLMTDLGGAVFMADGNWAYNEIVTDYSDRMEDLAFANVPVLSAVGTKLFAKYGFNEEQCEEILAYTIRKADDGKTTDEIYDLFSAEKGELFATITNKETFKQDIEEVLKARGLYCSRSSLAAGALISEKSKNKEICYLFLRMFASDDNAVLYNRECNGFTAYMSDFSQAKSTAYNKECQAIVENAYATPVWMNSTGLRLRMGHNNQIFPGEDLSFVSKIIDRRATIYDKGVKKGQPIVYTNEALSMINKVRENAKNNWSKWTSKL